MLTKLLSSFVLLLILQNSRDVRADVKCSSAIIGPLHGFLQFNHQIYNGLSVMSRSYNDENEVNGVLQQCELSQKYQDLQDLFKGDVLYIAGEQSTKDIHFYIIMTNPKTSTQTVVQHSGDNPNQQISEVHKLDFGFLAPNDDSLLRAVMATNLKRLAIRLNSTQEYLTWETGDPSDLVEEANVKIIIVIKDSKDQLFIDVTNENYPLHNLTAIVCNHIGSKPQANSNDNNVVTPRIYYRKHKFTPRCQIATVDDFGHITAWFKGDEVVYIVDGIYSCDGPTTGTCLGMWENEYCPQDTTNGLKFADTPAGAWTWATSSKICLQNDLSPVLRQCLSDASWGPILGQCSNNVTVPTVTETIYNILISRNDKVLADIHHILVTEVIKPIDIYLISRILEEISLHDSNKYEISSFMAVVNSSLDINKDDLKTSQFPLNSTDRILDSLDRAILKFSAEKRIEAHLSLLLVDTVELIGGNAIGVIIKSHGSGSNFVNFSTVPVENDEAFHRDNYDIGIRIFAKDLDHFTITVFNNDHLFNSNATEHYTVSPWVVSILSPEREKIEKVRIYFKNKDRKHSRTCNYWKYGLQDDIAIFGTWFQDQAGEEIREYYTLCEFKHTTHFGMLLSDQIQDDIVLTSITYLGTILSVFGTLSVLLVVFTSRQWRLRESTKKIVLNVSICNLLLIIFFFVSANVEPGFGCIAVGLILHEIVLSQFCWMFTISYISYSKLLVVFKSFGSHLILKCGLFAWGVPSIVVLITAYFSTSTYDKMNNFSAGMCYPKDKYLWYSVFIPVGLILLINLCIYMWICIAVRKSLMDKTQKSTAMKKLILLFFMMGISWVIGMIAVIFDIGFLLYLFAILSTLDGFATFYFYIVDSAKASDDSHPDSHIKISKQNKSREPIK